MHGRLILCAHHPERPGQMTPKYLRHSEHQEIKDHIPQILYPERNIASSLNFGCPFSDIRIMHYSHLDKIRIPPTSLKSSKAHLKIIRWIYLQSLVEVIALPRD